MNKSDFPIFKNNPKLVYLDNAATTQKPKEVIDAITEFYEKYNANIHRAIYNSAESTTQKYEKAREKVAKFFNADSKEIIFTKGTTDSINSLSRSIAKLFVEEKNEIIISEMEHHSNIIPWFILSKKLGFGIKMIPIKDDLTLDYEEAEKMINNKTALIAITHVSNITGTINDIERIIGLAKKNNALTFIDASQSAPRLKIDVKNLDCDFFACSSHKMYGPTGVGVLFGKKKYLEVMDPFEYGGGMVNTDPYSSTWREIPEKFEAGTPNIAGVIGFAKAIEFIENVGLNRIMEHEQQLVKYALEGLSKIPKMNVFSPIAEKNAGVISFNLGEIHCHDLATILDGFNYHTLEEVGNGDSIAVRAGYHCCMPLVKKISPVGTTRISFAIYNTKEDIDKLIEALKKAQEVFNK